MTNFELLLIFFIPVRKGLFCKASDINLHSELCIRSKPFFQDELLRAHLVIV